MINQVNTTVMNVQRSRYMNGELSHDAYYLWLADYIGADASMVPAKAEEIERSTDPHLNDIALYRWDRRDFPVRQLAYAKGLPWSLSDTVCVLKALARRAYNKPEVPK